MVGEEELKPLVERGLGRVAAHQSAWYVHEVHDVAFGRKLRLTVL